MEFDNRLDIFEPGDLTALVWDVSLTGAARGTKPATDAELEAAWKTLEQPDATRAYEALVADLQARGFRSSGTL